MSALITPPGIEFGFMSTTTNRDVALQYGQGEGGIVFEISMGFADKGVLQRVGGAMPADKGWVVVRGCSLLACVGG